MQHSLLVLRCYFKVRLDVQKGRGQWAVYYTRPQSFIVKISYTLPGNIWLIFLNFDWLDYKVKCSTALNTN